MYFCFYIRDGFQTNDLTVCLVEEIHFQGLCSKWRIGLSEPFCL